MRFHHLPSSHHLKYSRVEDYAYYVGGKLIADWPTIGLLPAFCFGHAHEVQFEILRFKLLNGQINFFAVPSILRSCNAPLRIPRSNIILMNISISNMVKPGPATQLEIHRPHTLFCKSTESPKLLHLWASPCPLPAFPAWLPGAMTPGGWRGPCG